MKAFRNNPAMKDKCRARLELRISSESDPKVDYDDYWPGGEAYRPLKYARELNIPVWVVYLADAIGKELATGNSAAEWPLDFLNQIPVGFDRWDLLWHSTCHDRLNRIGGIGAIVSFWTTLSPQITEPLMLAYYFLRKLHSAALKGEKTAPASWKKLRKHTHSLNLFMRRAALDGGIMCAEGNSIWSAANCAFHCAAPGPVNNRAASVSASSASFCITLSTYEDGNWAEIMLKSWTRERESLLAAFTQEAAL